jgi:hypothetical protein
MAKISVTSGEQLFDRVLVSVDDFSVFSGDAPKLFTATKRSRHLTDFFHSLLALSVTARLIRYGRYLIEEYSDFEDEYLRAKIVEFTRDKLLIYSGNCSDLDEIVARTLEASRKSKRDISKAIKTRVQNEFPDPSCYLCGIKLTYGSTAEVSCASCGQEVIDYEKEFVTYEHLWPSAYGGDTDVRNLLPACRWCNGNKGSLTSWQWANIAATVLANRPTDKDWRKLSRDAKIAVTMRVAWDVAVRHNLSLREAALKAGPYSKEFALVDPEDSSDFFNIRAHDLASLGLDWSLR